MAQTELKRQIGLFDAVMLISGDMIGTGIFISTGVIAAQVPSPGGVLLVWIFGGLLALAGALSCAELSASMPYAGGDYNYIREAYGRLMGFLSGWSSFLVTFSGAIAFLAVIFNEYMSFFVPVLGSKEVFFSATLPLISINVTAGTLFSIFAVLAISALHCIGVRQGTVTQNILTVIKIGSLVGIILLGIFIGKGSTENFSPLFDWDKIAKSSVFASAFIPAIFAYSGWNAIIYIAGEVKDPERNLPKALLMGNLIVIVLYLAINVVYIYGVPVTEMKGAATNFRSRDHRVIRLSDFGIDHWAHHHFDSRRAQRRDHARTADLLRDGARWRVFQAADLRSSKVRHAEQCDYSPSGLVLFADTHEYLGHLIYLCQRGDHAIFGVDGRLGDRAALQAAGIEAAL